MARGFRAALPSEWFFPLPCARHTRLPAIASPTSACARRCSFSPGGAPGVHSCPSQGCSRVRVVAPRELRGGRIALRAIPAAFLSDRAHVPFSPDPPRVPIDFRRDDRPPVGNTCESKRRSIGGCRGVDFWASTPVCGPIPPSTRSAGRSFLPWALPLAGLAGTWPCIACGLDPAPDHRPPGIHGPLGRVAAAHPLSAHGFEASFPTEMITARIERARRAVFTSLMRRMLPARFAVPSAY
jgi:hypothetical protein